MRYNMKKWFDDMVNSPVKKPLPILSFPAVQLMGTFVRELISDSGLQARGMALISGRVDAAAAVSYMDLSVEAECFGSEIRISDNEVPTVVGSIISSAEDAEALEVPPVGSGRTRLYLDSVGKALELINDRPVFSGAIGPFSLAGRLVGVSDVMVFCYTEPDMVHSVMEKATAFVTNYINAYKASGANGVLMAEPLTGLLSPALAEEFSAPYVKKIIDNVQDENFAVIYHNCGNNTPKMIDTILSQGAFAYHFGNAVCLDEILSKVPENIPVWGNIDPAGQIRNGTPESVRSATLSLLKACGKYPNFIISSGCDIPLAAPWDNIDAFFSAVKEFYGN